MEQRSLPRRSTSIRATLHDGSRVADTRIVNMTQMGLKLRTLAPPPAGAHVQVRVDDLVVAGRVVWSNRSEFGLFVSDGNPLFSKFCVIANSDRELRAPGGYRKLGMQLADTIASNRTEYALFAAGSVFMLAMALSGLIKVGVIR